MGIKKVGVIGCGLMGAGIAEVAARSGCETVVREVSDEFLEKGLFTRICGSIWLGNSSLRIGTVGSPTRILPVRGLCPAPLGFGAFVPSPKGTWSER